MTTSGTTLPKILLLDFDLTLTDTHSKGIGFEVIEGKCHIPPQHPGRPYKPIQIVHSERWHRILEEATNQGIKIGIVSNHGGLKLSDKKDNIRSIEAAESIETFGSHRKIFFRTNLNEGEVIDGGTPALKKFLDIAWPDRTFLKEDNDFCAMILDEKNVANRVVFRSDIDPKWWDKAIDLLGKKAHIKQYLKQNGMEDISFNQILLVDDTDKNLTSAAQMGCKILKAEKGDEHLRYLEQMLGILSPSSAPRPSW